MNKKTFLDGRSLTLENIDEIIKDHHHIDLT